VEVLVVVAVLGILAAIALSMVTRIRDASAMAKSKRNAQTIASVSSALAGVGQAHVLPDSLGGCLGTAMLLREGVTVSSGPFAGKFFTIGPLPDRELEGAAKYLKIVYDADEVRMIYDSQGTQEQQ
jgi:type II secretory pathway pseudopilin PulG